MKFIIPVEKKALIEIAGTDFLYAIVELKKMLFRIKTMEEQAAALISKFEK